MTTEEEWARSRYSLYGTNHDGIITGMVDVSVSDTGVLLVKIDGRTVFSANVTDLCPVCQDRKSNDEN